MLNKVIGFICFVVVVLLHLYFFRFFKTTEKDKEIKVSKDSVRKLKTKKSLNLSSLAPNKEFTNNSRGRSIKHDYVYCLPFMPGNSYLVSQTEGRTHKGSNKNAIDFVIPRGAGVFAARPGIVVNLSNRFSSSGRTKEYLNKANFIFIRHDDGTNAMYAHLDYDGVKVRVGDYVKLGQQIGYSGNTGFSNGAHLNFEILDSNSHSIPIGFWTKTSLREKLETNK